MITEKEIIEQLKSGRISLPPLKMRVLPENSIIDDYKLDACVEVSWRNRSTRFALECKPLSTPKAFRASMALLKAISFPRGTYPMILMPFLSEIQLLELESENISGIDLCGNGVVMVPGKYEVFRYGGKNRFPSSAAIKNIYRLNSSMVARSFLARFKYPSVQTLWREVNERNLLVHSWNKNPMSMSTVSKALKSLEDDLIVNREDGIALLQPDKLLEKLVENHTPPKITDRIRLKIAEGDGTVVSKLRSISQQLKLPVVATGYSSVGRYAVMQRGELLSVYCPCLDELIPLLSGNAYDRFPNIELLKTEDETAFFDARQDDTLTWSSPVQTYLELMTGDKRDKETAEQIKVMILSTVDPLLK